MNANTQQPTSLWDKLKTSLDDAMIRSISMMKAGLSSSLPIAGATGYSVKTKYDDQRTDSKSKRIMRLERGPQPESVGDRRFIRYAERMTKRKNSYCNNVYTDHKGDTKVVMN